MEDQIERWESAAELQYDKMSQGEGKLKCACGNIFNENEGTVLSPNPYAMPSCPICTEEYFAEMERGPEYNQSIHPTKKSG